MFFGSLIGATVNKVGSPIGGLDRVGIDMGIRDVGGPNGGDDLIVGSSMGGLTAEGVRVGTPIGGLDRVGSGVGL